MLHGLFFHPHLFETYYPSYNGNPYIFQDTDGIYKLQGPEILAQMQSHFNCSTINGGMNKKISNLKHH